MTVVGVVVVMGLLALLLIRTRALGPISFAFAAVWGFLLGATPAGPPVAQEMDQLGAALWQAVSSL